MKKIFAVIAFAVITLAASAQSANFDLAKSLDVQNSILKALSANYVDSVQFNKLINTGSREADHKQQCRRLPVPFSRP